MCLAALPSALHGCGRALDEVHRVPTVGAELAEQVVGGGAAGGRRLAVVDGARLTGAGDLADVLGEALVVLGRSRSSRGNQLHCVPREWRYGMPGPKPAPTSSQLRFSNENTIDRRYRGGGAVAAPQGVGVRRERRRGRRGRGARGLVRDSSAARRSTPNPTSTRPASERRRRRGRRCGHDRLTDAVNAVTSASGSATVTVIAEWPARRSRLGTFSWKCTHTPRSALVPNVRPSSASDRRAPAAVHHRYPLVTWAPATLVSGVSTRRKPKVATNRPSSVRVTPSLPGRTPNGPQNGTRRRSVA